MHLFQCSSARMRFFMCTSSVPLTVECYISSACTMGARWVAPIECMVTLQLYLFFHTHTHAHMHIKCIRLHGTLSRTACCSSYGYLLCMCHNYTPHLLCSCVDAVAKTIETNCQRRFSECRWQKHRFGFGTFRPMAWLCVHECIRIWQRAANEPKSYKCHCSSGHSKDDAMVPRFTLDNKLRFISIRIMQTVNKTVPRTGNARPALRHTIRYAPISHVITAT